LILKTFMMNFLIGFIFLVGGGVGGLTTVNIYILFLFKIASPLRVYLHSLFFSLPAFSPSAL